MRHADLPTDLTLPAQLRALLGRGWSDHDIAQWLAGSDAQQALGHQVTREDLVRLILRVGPHPARPDLLDGATRVVLDPHGFNPSLAELVGSFRRLPCAADDSAAVS
ncbi:MAG TPA: hypothetical protein VHX44_10520 [Planctomycetota bacterium]|jgi:hypothetical protein|nr:hypothetical protein [Planctomycetota bacterium]